MTAAIALPVPARVGQATAVEQSRAIAEVYAAVEMARRFPRDEDTAVAEMRKACKRPELATQAFFRLPRGGETVDGQSIHLARELARCWGNVSHGVAELRRDDDHGQSEMLAAAWDLERNNRVHHIFIVPHERDKKVRGEKIRERLPDLQSVYENNANNGARRLRECIFAVLPKWFVEEAAELCRETLKAGDGKPVADRVADVLARFAPLGVTVEDLARKIGRPADKWTPDDLANLTVVYRSLKKGEISRDQEFPPATVTAAEIRSNAAKPASAEPAPARQAEQPKGRKRTTEQNSKMQAFATEHGIDRDLRLAAARVITGHKDLTTTSALTIGEMSLFIDHLERIATQNPGEVADALRVLVDEAENRTEEPS